MSGQIPKLILGLGCFTALIGTDVTFAKVGSSEYSGHCGQFV
jgi:hypothetical protein